MACPDYTLSKNGRAGIGVVQPQSGLNFPLIAPSSDIKYLLADFYLSYDDSGEYSSPILPTKHPLRIKYLYGVGCFENPPISSFPTAVHAADIVVVDSNERVVFNSNDANVSFNMTAWGNDYKIYEWKSTYAVCRLVAHTTWPDDDKGTLDENTPRNYNKYLTPINAKLDERAVYKMPRRLLSLRVKNGQTISPRYRNNVTFTNGYNTTLTPATSVISNFRNTTNVAFAAVAGSGLGKYGNCGSSTGPVPITKINGVPATAGDFLLSGADCLWARRPVTSALLYPKILTEATEFVITDAVDFSYVTTENLFAGETEEYDTAPSATAQQQIGADCEPCCSCDDYVDTAKYLNETSYQYKLIGKRAENVRTAHENNISRWLDQRACSIQRPLRLLMVPQRCPFIDVVLLLCNPCETCLPPTQLTLDLSLSGTIGANVTPSLECGYTELYAPGINGGAVGIAVTNNGTRYSAPLPQLKAGDSGYIKFRVKFTQTDNSTSPPTAVKARGQYAVTGVLTGTIISTGLPILPNCGNNLADGSPPPPAVAEVTRSLNCNAAGQTILPC
jgi:hypothetical protein